MCFYYAVNVYVYSNYIFFGIIVPNDFFFFSLLFFFFLFPFEWNINLKIVEVKIPNGLLKHRIYLKNDQLYRYLILTWCRVQTMSSANKFSFSQIDYGYYVCSHRWNVFHRLRGFLDNYVWPETYAMNEPGKDIMRV